MADFPKKSVKKEKKKKKEKKLSIKCIKKSS